MQKSKVNDALKRLRAAHKGHLTRICQEIEPLLANSENLKIVELRFLVLKSAFGRFEQAHIACVDGVDSPEELQALSARFQKYIYEFGERIKERLSCARADQIASAVQPGDSVSQDNATSAANKSHLSDGSSSSRLSVKIKVAKAEKAIAQLKLRQLGRKLELQRKWDAVHRGERELLEAENKLERATLKAHILKEDDGQSQLFPHEADKECDPTPVQAPLESPYPDKRPSSRTFSSDSEDTKAVPGTRFPLNCAASEWKGGPHLSIPAAKPHEDVPSHDEKIQELLQQHQRTIQHQQQTF